MAKAKTLSLEDIYDIVDALTLDDLLDIQSYVNNKVQNEKTKAQIALEKIQKTNA